MIVNSLAPRKISKTPKLKHETLQSVEFLSIFRCQAPPQKRKAPLLETFWRRFCLRDAFATYAYSWVSRITSVTDVHVILKKIECERTIWSTNVAKGRLSVIYIVVGRGALAPWILKFSAKTGCFLSFE